MSFGSSSGSSPQYAEFRRKLDDVLRRRDPQALRAFLIAEGQWDEGTTTNPERAMWMMIATSPALAALRDEAITWLGAHGFAEEARTLGRESGGPRSPASSPRRGGGAARGGRGGRGGRPPSGSGTGPHGGRPNSGRPNSGRPNSGRPNSGRGKPGGLSPAPRWPDN